MCCFESPGEQNPFTKRGGVTIRNKSAYKTRKGPRPCPHSSSGLHRTLIAACGVQERIWESFPTWLGRSCKGYSSSVNALDEHTHDEYVTERTKYPSLFFSETIRGHPESSLN